MTCPEIRLHNFNQLYANDKVIRHHSEPFKLKILAELSTSEYTKSELGKL